jgi:hypothetical protein
VQGETEWRGSPSERLMVSDDGGKSWGRPAPLTFPHDSLPPPNCQAHEFYLDLSGGIDDDGTA